MAAELIVGGWFASSVISKLISELVDCAKGHKLGLKDELARLEKQLPKIEAVVTAVDQDLIRKKNQPLDRWLCQIRDAADQADNVMDEIEYNFAKEKVEAGKPKVSKAISSVKTFLERAVYNDPVLKMLKKVIKEIDQVAADVDKFYMLVKGLVKEQNEMLKFAMKGRDTSSVLKVRTRVFGREKEKNNIVRKLLNPEYNKTIEVNFAVLPLLGAGGIGKTTLAQYVYNDPEVKKHFELRMWVCISNNFDKELLTKKLYESAFARGAKFVNLDVMHTKLVERLKSERFLVVFDDAWNDNDRRGWTDLFGLLKSGVSGSMILLTTRDETVVSELTGYNLMNSVHLRGLDKDDMWDLFKECAFRDEDPRYHKKLVEIGREIVNKKLMGSPLAAETVGKILSSKLNEDHWTSVLNNELWNLPQGPNDIMPALRLTYQYLPSELKPCFSFCSIFPQDHVFIKNDLINMWIALGLVPRDFNAEKKPEDLGSKYFEDLLNRSIFSLANPVSNAHLRYPAYTYHSETSGKQFVEGYIMHDLMHDLSAFVSQSECCRYNTNKPVHIPITVRHLFIHVGNCCEFRKLSQFNLMNVRTLILQFNDSDHPKQEFINELVTKLKNLRVLTLFSLTLSEVPKGVSDLLHLRYLSLSSYMLTVFPQSMYRLYLLETLVCGGYGFKGQADVLVNLINMRHLIASESFVGMIANIGKLTALQELSFRVSKESGFEIFQLRDMKELRHLSIININYVDSHVAAIEANLKDKDSIQKLNFRWDVDQNSEEVFDKLTPHYGLKELRIRNYMGRRSPIWLQAQYFSKLEILSFECMWALKELSPAKEPKEWMRCLKELIIDDCPSLCVLPPLPIGLKKLKLKGLGLNVMPNLWEDQSCNSESLPCLVSIKISECPNLLSLAEGLLQKPEQFAALEKLTISYCNKLELPIGYLNRFISLKMLDVNHCPTITPLKHAFFLPFPSVRIDQYADLNSGGLHELGSSPSLQKKEALLIMIDCPESNLMSFLRMRDYMGKWPPTWFTQILSMLEHLTIDGGTTYIGNYVSHELPSSVNQLMSLVRETVRSNPCRSLEMAYLSDMPELQQFYLTTQHIKHVLFLKKLTVTLLSKSCFMPPLSLTLKELRLSHLNLDIIPNLYENQSSKSGILPSLVALTIDECPNLASLAEGFLQKPEQFPALTELTISSCKKLMYFPEGGFTNFFSLKELHIVECPKFSVLPPLPFTLKELRLSHLELNVMPNFCENQSRDSGRLRSPVSFTINKCRNLLSTVKGFRQEPEQFSALEKLSISGCYNLKLPLGYLNKLISLKKLDVIGCPMINPFVLVFFLPFQSICINDIYVNINAGGEQELSSQHILQKEEALLFVIDCPDSNLVRSLRTRGYMGTWPRSWFTQNLSMLEYLNIDGGTQNLKTDVSCNYLSQGLPNPVNQLLSLLKISIWDFESIEMEYISDMLELKQFYITTQHIEQMQYLKRLTVTPFSKSFVMPPLPLTLKELRLSHLGLDVIPNLYKNQSNESGSLPSLVALQIFKCPNLISLAKGLLEDPQIFPALTNMTVTRCCKLELSHAYLNKFISLKNVDIISCNKIHRSLCSLVRAGIQINYR